METQPADINETWFAYLMEPTLHYADAEPSSNLLDTATTLEFPGVAAVAQQSRLQTAPTLFYTPAEPPEQRVKASAILTLDPAPFAAASLDAAVPDLQLVAMLSSVSTT